MKKYWLPVMLLAVFETVAVTLWLTMDNLFYLFNFSYIGFSTALGIFLLSTRPSGGAAPGRTVYAGLSGTGLPGKYADRGVLVLSVYRCI